MKTSNEVNEVIAQVNRDLETLNNEIIRKCRLALEANAKKAFSRIKDLEQLRVALEEYETVLAS